jgi:ribonucleoside-diphosphate reductase alpha chain
MTLEELKEKGEAEEWLSPEGFTTLSGGYLLKGETPLDMYKRVSKGAASYYDEPLRTQLESRFLKYIKNNWLCLATPVASNVSSERGLPISCYGNYMPDSISGIFKTYHEAAMLTKNGGGVGTYVGGIRSRGASIKGNGQSEGIIPWLRVLEQTFQSVGQGGVRRGAVATYLDADHGDIDEFIDIRRPTGDISRRCLSNNFHHAVVYSDDFMNRAMSGDKHAREVWEKGLKSRLETGEHYMMFGDNANRNLPDGYVKNNLKVKTSQLCVAGETLITVSSKDFGLMDLEIKDLKPYLDKHKDLSVLSNNLENGKNEFKKIKAFAQTSPKAKVLKITDDKTGKSIKVTPEHKVYTITRGYVMAKDLKADDELVFD